MGRISTSTAPTETFNILINYSDAGAKRKKRLKILLIIAGIVLLLGVIAAVVAVVVVKNTSTNSSSDKFLNLDNDTLLLIGGKNSDNDFVNDVEAVGIKDCPKIKQLPDIDHNLKSLSTLTEDGYLIICAEYHKVIACHSKLVQEEEEIDMPEMKYETAPRNHDVSKY